MPMKLLEQAAPQAPAAANVMRASSIPHQEAPNRPRQLLELACKVLDARRGGIAFLTPEGDLAEHICWSAAADSLAEREQAAPLLELLPQVLEQPGPALIDNRLARGPFLGVPVRCAGRSRGVLYLAREPGGLPFQPRDVETLAPVRTWLEQGQLGEEAHLLSQLHLLNRVAQAAAGNLELGLILQRALRELDRHLPLNIELIWLAEDNDAGGLTLAATSSIPVSRTSELGLDLGTRLAGDQTPFAPCLRNGQGVYVDLRPPEAGVRGQGSGDNRLASLTPDPWLLTPDPLSQCLAVHRASCFFAAPLRAGDQTVGILQSVCTRPTGFTAEQIQLLYLVADLLGPAISNCRLYERQRTTCEQLRTTQEQLIRAEKMRALGELASGMAHDFNNSLCGVLGFLELTLTDKALSSSCRSYLESARTCALDAAQTVRRVQEFARCRRKDPVFQELDVNDLVHQTVELTRPKWDHPGRIRATPIRVEVQAEATAVVSGNAAELREVLTNLVFNAVDAMPQGGTLVLRTWSNDQGVFLAVQDSGVGMRPAVRQRLFEPFFTTKGERGNGLGLSVSFGIVQGHGGEIGVVSEVNRGTTFTVRLPLPRPAQPEGGGSRIEDRESTGNPPSSILHPPSSRPPGLRILVIEDEESIRTLLGTILRQLGHQPRLAAGARAGLALFAAECFDVVLTDMGLPGMSGEELARKIARQAPQVPVVLLTGWADQLRMEAPSLPGVARILGKPVTITSLDETLAAVCPRP
jgi:signal transduction histidine kinase